MTGFYQWIDLLWLPVAVIAAHKHKRLIAAGFIAACMLMMRLQVELMDSIHYDSGILHFIKAGAFERGLVTYSVFYLLYCIYAHLARNSFKAVFLAASLSVFFAVLFVSTIVMII